MKRPVTIAFCGIDGSGKSTQLERIKKRLENDGKTVNVTKAKMDRTKILFDVAESVFGDPYAYHPHIAPEVMNTVIACDVACHYRFNVKEQENCDFLLCDRHKLCYLAYSDGFGGEVKWIEEIMRQFPDPDITVYIKGNVESSIARLRARTEKPIRTDEDPEILKLVLAAYDERIKEFDSSRIIVVDSSEKIEVITEKIYSQIMDICNKELK